MTILPPCRTMKNVEESNGRSHNFKNVKKLPIQLPELHLYRKPVYDINVDKIPNSSKSTMFLNLYSEDLFYLLKQL